MDRAFTKLLNKNGIIGARDKEHNGIWMGLSEKNKNILMMTNNRYKFKIIDDVEYISRGTLNEDLISGKYKDKIHKNKTINLDEYFRGFNIILCETVPDVNCYFLSNRMQSTCKEMNCDKEIKQNQANVCKLSDGIHIISNGMLNDDVIWTRVRILRKRLNEWVNIIKTKQTREDNAELKEDADDESTISVDVILNDLSRIMSDDQDFEQKELPSIEQCEFSYLGP